MAVAVAASAALARVPALLGVVLRRRPTEHRCRHHGQPREALDALPVDVRVDGVAVELVQRRLLRLDHLGRRDLHHRHLLVRHLRQADLLEDRPGRRRVDEQRHHDRQAHVEEHHLLEARRARKRAAAARVVAAAAAAAAARGVVAVDDAAVLVDGDGEREADGAAQPAPRDHERVAPVVAVLRDAEHRDDAEHDDAADGGHRRVREHPVAEVLPEVRRVRLGEREDDQDAREREDDRVDQVAHHPPEGVQEVLALGVDAHLAKRRRVDEAVRDDGEHARHLEAVEGGLGEVEDEEGRRDRADDLDVGVAVGALVKLEPQHREDAHRDAEQRPEDRHAEEEVQDVAAVLALVLEPLRQPAVGDRLEEDRVDHDRRAVVEQRLGLDERRERLLDAHLAQQRHDRHRVGRREDAADQHARLPRPAVHGAVDAGGEARRHDEARQRQEEGARRDLGEDVPVDGEGRLEEQRRQQQVQEQVRIHARDLAQRVAQVPAMVVDVVGHPGAHVALQLRLVAVRVLPAVGELVGARLDGVGGIKVHPHAEKHADQQQARRVRERKPREEVLRGAAADQEEREAV